MLKSILVLCLCTSTIYGFRFGTLYDAHPNYVNAQHLDQHLKTPIYSYENPFAHPSNINYRRRYYNSGADGDSPILHYTNRQSPDGHYDYSYETANNIRAEQSGYNDNGENVVRGSYSYIGPDGVTYTVNYIADRNGYRAYGAHLPQQPHEVAPITGSRRRYFLPADRNTGYYSSTTIRPSYVNVTPKSPSHDAFVAATRRPVYSVVIDPTASSHSYQHPFASSTTAVIDDGRRYTATGRPLYPATTSANVYA